MAILNKTVKSEPIKPSITIGVKWINIDNSENIYCGKGSPLGNPYATKDMSLSERNIACDKYHILLKEQSNINGSVMRNEMKRILKLYKSGNNINLQCYCSPKRCHCESIKKLIEGVTYNTPKTEPINETVNGFRDEYSFLSNFSYLTNPMVVDGITYLTTEHYFQAMKTLNIDERNAIANHSLKGLKSLGRAITLRDNWETIKTEVMMETLRYKFSDANPLLLKKLLNTGNTILIEYNDWNDTYWGVSSKTGKGKNILGKLLMTLRDELKSTSRYWTGTVIKELKPNEIFVFGSNPEGRHGKGAAKYALNNFGAIYGNGRGIQGSSYALVTKNLKPMYTEESTGLTYVEYGGIPMDWLISNIKELYEYASNNTDKDFLIPYTMHSNNLNGYTNLDIYNAFHSIDIPKNIIFHESYKNKPEPIVKSKPRLIIAGGRDFDNYELAKESLLQLVESNWIKDEPIVISGGAKGGDYIGECLANEFGLNVEVFQADWKDMREPCIVKTNQYGEYNALAGMNRNHSMGDSGTHLLAFWNGKSKGTLDMIEYMKSLGKPVKVIMY